MIESSNIGSIDIDRELALKFYEEMLLIRRFEEKCAEEYSAGRIRGFLHLYIGEEAVATGIINCLQPEDAIFATYREHGHALLRGLKPERIMAEMFGKFEGVCRGRGGSMHLFDRSKNFFGGNAIVAGALPMAVGFGFAQKMKKQRGITVCFFGEGAIAEGEFHEASNLAALWKIPVLFVCENNLYAMGTALSHSESQTDLCLKAQSYSMRTLRADGMDVIAIHKTAMLAVRDVRNHGEPIFMQCDTYRFRAHSMFDPELYREKSEVEEWKTRDPIPRLEQQILASGYANTEQIQNINRRVALKIIDSVKFAEQGALEPPSEVSRFVYSDPIPPKGRGVNQ